MEARGRNIDHASGTFARWPALTETLAYLRTGDTLIGAKLDCRGRSVNKLKNVAEELERREGRLSRTVSSNRYHHAWWSPVLAIAEFEHDPDIERTNED